MSIDRRIVHVTGPSGSGKTTFIERVLESNHSRLLMAARCEAVDGLEEPHESTARKDVELRRYLAAGSSEAARYRFPPGDQAHVDFFCSTFMADYSQGIFTEGDSPVESPEIVVYVTRPLPKGRRLLQRSAGRKASGAPQPRTSGRDTALFDLMRALSLLSEGYGTKQFPARPSDHTGGRHTGGRHARGWRLAEECAGLERAQVVVLNVRNDAERGRAESMLAEITRLRKDESVFQDVIGWSGNRLPITAAAADLSDRRDPGLKRLVARVKRKFNASS